MVLSGVTPASHLPRDCYESEQTAMTLGRLTRLDEHHLIHDTLICPHSSYFE